MRRIVLSRKGFDSSPQGGGSASPIFEDGRIFSIPIPEPFPPAPKKYKDLYFNGVSGIDALKECSITSVSSQSFCHYDPALNKEEGIFGQSDSSQSELSNREVGDGDLFLFFGFYKKFSFKKIELHHLFGWLQIEKIIKGDQEIRNYLDQNNMEHPHGYGEFNTYKNNAIYIGKKNLEIHGVKRAKKGYGLFKKTHPDLVLTRNGKSKGSWKLPKKYFSDSNDIFLGRLKWLDKENCFLNNFQRGQEFVLDSEKNPKIIDWAHSLIEKHG